MFSSVYISIHHSTNVWKDLYCVLVFISKGNYSLILTYIHSHKTWCSKIILIIYTQEWMRKKICNLCNSACSKNTQYLNKKTRWKLFQVTPVGTIYHVSIKRTYTFVGAVCNVLIYVCRLYAVYNRCRDVCARKGTVMFCKIVSSKKVKTSKN